MILTFEVDKQARSLDIHFDEDGRDRLISLLAMCKERGDHQHLFRFVEAGPNSEITCAHFDEESNAIGEVTLYLLPPDAEPVRRITE